MKRKQPSSSSSCVCLCVFQSSLENRRRNKRCCQHCFLRKTIPRTWETCFFHKDSFPGFVFLYKKPDQSAKTCPSPMICSQMMYKLLVICHFPSYDYHYIINKSSHMQCAFINSFMFTFR